jgi:hypothetical protein
MLIKQNSNKILKNLLQKFFGAKVLLSIIFIALSILLFWAGDRFGQPVKAFVGPVIEEVKKNIQDLSYLIKNPSSKKFISNKETLSFDIDFLDLQDLDNRRKLAVENYSLKFVENNFISANMSFQGQKFPVKIKLKGSTAHEHQGVKKWSFKVQLKGDSRFNGMQSFSLMDPKRRNWQMEWFYRSALKEEGIISKKYDFINVSINGVDMGLYAFDEGFNKTMLERNQRRDGPIISFKDDSFWLEGAAYGALSPNEWGDYYLSAPIEIKNSKNNTITQNAQKAIDLMAAFRRGELPARKVFDIDKLAKTMALGDIFKSSHGFLPFNSVFYYNPIIHRLEPIPDDTYSETGLMPDGIFRFNDYWVTGIFLDQITSDFDFAEAYLRELYRMTRDESYLDSLLMKYGNEINENKNAFSADSIIRIYGDLNPSRIYGSIKTLRQILNPHVAVIANFEKFTPQGVALKIASSTPLPIEIISINIDDKFKLLPCKLDEKKCVNKIKGRGHNSVLNYSEYEFVYPESFDISLYSKSLDDVGSIKVNYRILGSDNIRSDSIFGYKAFDNTRIIIDPKLMNPNYKEFKFIDYDEIGKVIKIKPGFWRLENDLIIPENYIFILGNSTTIDFINSASIISYSPILFEGTEEFPIKLISSDVSSGSLTVFSNGKKSKLTNVVIDGLVNKSDSTGAVTFFESPVDIKNTSFLNINSEDALNIINTSFTIVDSIFSNNFSDSLDIDFGVGAVENTKFNNSGNDAIDLSGSNVDIYSTFISNSGDKAISIGENSFTRIDKSEISSCKIGVAMKDQSSAIINDILINDCKYGVAIYQKKPDFGPANAIIDSIAIEGSYIDYIVEENSTLLLDGIELIGEFKNVYQRLYEEI